MPGLVGFSCSGTDREACVRALDAMKSLVTYRDSYGIDESFCDGTLCASRAHTRILQPEPQPAQLGEVRVWLEGEFLNRDELASAGSRAEGARSDAALLAALYRESWDANETDFSFLREIDGTWAAVIYDAARGLLHLLADRYGFRHLYWSERAGRVAWASELKAFLEVPGFDPKIDAEALDRFFSAGFFTGDRTWFEDVELLPGGTVLSFDLDEGSRHATSYWSYGDIRVMDAIPDEAELIEEWARLFEHSVARCCATGRVGALLSGGLDSRAIVAAMPRDLDPVHLLTFGQAGSDDVELARRVAALRGAEHHVELFDEHSWLASRYEGVWWTDGQLNLIDLHSAFTLEPRRAWFDINVSGFIGDLVMGGSYVGDTPQHEFDAMQDRVRRFTSVGLRMSQPLGESRLPFVGNALLEFSFGVPGALRNHHRLFNAMLLRRYPAYYRSIPWQETGAPISWPHAAVRATHYWSRASEMLKSRLASAGFAAGRRRQFGSYELWMRREPARSRFEALLTDPDALYREYIRDVDVAGLWRRHLAGEELGRQLGAYLSFELFLQQLFRGKHREGPSRDALRAELQAR